MLVSLQEKFVVDRTAQRVSQSVGACVMCKHVMGAKIFHRPWGPTVTATYHNEAVHWDFLQLCPSNSGQKYVLVLKDSLSHFCELFLCSSPSSSAAAMAVLEWAKRYGRPEVLMLDKRTHFRNAMVDELCARLKTDRRFSPVYSCG